MTQKAFSPKNSPIRIATRGSKLALWQAGFVANKLEALGYNTKLQIVTTKGDRIQDRFLNEIGGKGLFVKEIEEAMHRGKVDIAVHSLKDMPIAMANDFILGAIMERGPIRDLVICKHPPHGLTKGRELESEDIKKLAGMRIGTASLRRSSLIKSRLASGRFNLVRGNIDTRIARLQKGENAEYDALILAEAAITRLDYRHLHLYPLAPNWFIPSPAQGAIAIQTYRNSPYLEALRAIGCPHTTTCVAIEREVLKLAGGDCTMPIGCHVYHDPAKGLRIGRAVILDYEGKYAYGCYSESAEGIEHRISDFAANLYQKLQEAGCDGLIANLKATKNSLFDH